MSSRYALEVCEGQQLDMDFEHRDDVSAEHYLEMIRLKTAVLLSCALQVGASVAGAAANERERLGAFGEHLGLAFQLRDDLLDAFGDPLLTGKQRGGDLRNGKKTLLLIRGLERSAEQGSSALRTELRKSAADRNVQQMLNALEELGVRAEVEEAAARHESAALAELQAVKVPQERKEPLRGLAAMLMARAH